MATLRRLAAVLCLIIFAGLPLASCFISQQPFITPATADYPFATGLVVAKFQRTKAAPSVWSNIGRWAIVRDGAYYKMLGLPEDNSSDETEPFLVKCLDGQKCKTKGGYAISQMRHTDPDGRTYYVYALLQFTDPSTATFRSFNGPYDVGSGDNDPSTHLSRDECAHLSERTKRVYAIAIKDFENGKSCELQSFEALKRLFMEFVRAGAQSDEAYVVLGNE
jgi:hypothetical protein